MRTQKACCCGCGRCLNCLLLGHMVRNCMAPLKCRRCGPACSGKHAGALHAFYVRSSVGGGNGGSGLSKVIDTETSQSSSDDEQPIVRISTPNTNNTVLLRTSAVRVINRSTGRSTLVYGQHGTASQATLISERLKNELNLAVDKKRNVTIRTLAQQTTSSGGLRVYPSVAVH